MSTKVQLREDIKRESRIKSGVNLDSLVDKIVIEIMDDYGNLARYGELLQVGTVITLVAAQQAYSLPANFQNLAVVRYGRGPNPTTFRNVLVQTPTVAQTWSGGIPKFYRIVAGSKISLWPYADVVVVDQLLIDYYIKPSSLFVLDGDEFPVPRLQSAVKKAAISRMQRFYSAAAESQLTDADADASFIAGLGGG